MRGQNLYSMEFKLFPSSLFIQFSVWSFCRKTLLIEDWLKRHLQQATVLNKGRYFYCSFLE